MKITVKYDQSDIWKNQKCTWNFYFELDNAANGDSGYFLTW